MVKLKTFSLLKFIFQNAAWNWIAVCLGIFLGGAGGLEAVLQNAAAQNYAPFSAAEVQELAQSRPVQVPEGDYFMDDFESSSPSWLEFEKDCTAELTLRMRQQGEAFSGKGYEYLQVVCRSEGSKIYLAYPIPPKKVNAALSVQTVLSSNRSGIELLGRVVLPYTVDPVTGKAFCLYVSNRSATTAIRSWQKLTLQNVEREMMSEVRRIQRERKDIQFDLREAYLDHVVLNVYSGMVTVDVFVDRLEVSGSAAGTAFRPLSVPAPSSSGARNVSQENMRDFPPVTHEEAPAPELAKTAALPLPDEAAQTPAVQTPAVQTPAVQTPAASDGRVVQESAGSGASQKHQVALLNGVVLIDEKPIFVRAIRYSGEKLEFLANLGFNTVWLPEFPTYEMEAEARLQNIWFICPMPLKWDQAGDYEEALLKSGKLRNRSLDRVIAWDLGIPPGFNDIQQMAPEFREMTALALVRRHLEKIRKISEDVLPRRPSLCFPHKEFAEYSDFCDILVLDRSPMNSTHNFVDYGLWMRQMNNLAVNRQLIFAKIPSQFSPILKAQWRQIALGIRNSSHDRALDPEEPGVVPDALPFEQIRLMAFNALIAGSRGLFFDSTSRLDAPDEETVFRRKALSLVNLEFLVLEQWISRGSSFTTIASDHDNVAGGILATPYVRLMIPMYIEEDGQYVNGPGAERQVKFMVRGMPDTYGCWNYSLSGLSPIRTIRRVGGVEIELEELPLLSTVVMTQNMKIISSITQRILLYAPLLAQRMLELAEMRLEKYLRSYGADRLQGNDAMWFERAKNYLQAAEKALQTKEYADAFMLAQRAMRPICFLEKRAWKELGKNFPSPNFQPAGVAFRSQKLHEKWRNAIQEFEPGPNLFTSGDFEEPVRFKADGWINFRLYPEKPGIVVRANIRQEAAHTGNFGIEMGVLTNNKKRGPVILDSAPLTIRSPKVYVGPPGTVYQVDVWLNIPKKLRNTVDGVKVTDTNSGDVLAERIMQTDGWQKISFQRIVCSDQPVAVQISITGFGIAYLDDVSIRPLRETPAMERSE
ncbi:MAG: hypothetical protein IJD43_02605 [Thermoguttaceae bacterium]|nr:hypothetical protein [Thermoguttaceae bacterium]